MAGSVSIQDAERRSFRGTKLMVSPLGRSISTNADWPLPSVVPATARSPSGQSPAGPRPLAPPAAHLHHHARCTCREVVERDHFVIQRASAYRPGGVAHYAPNGTAVRHHGKPSLRGAHARRSRLGLRARGHDGRALGAAALRRGRGRCGGGGWLARPAARGCEEQEERDGQALRRHQRPRASRGRAPSPCHGQIAAPYGATRAGWE